MQRTLAPPERRVARVSGVERLGAYHVIGAEDPDGPRDPAPGQFYMLAAAECWGGQADERPKSNMPPETRRIFDRTAPAAQESDHNGGR